MDILFTLSPSVVLEQGDEAVPEVDEHPGGDDHVVHAHHALHYHQGDPHALQHK